MRIPAGHRIIIILIITSWRILPPEIWRMFSQLLLTRWITGGLRLANCWIGRSELVGSVWLGWTNHVVGHTFGTQSVKIDSQAEFSVPTISIFYRLMPKEAF